MRRPVRDRTGVAVPFDTPLLIVLAVVSLVVAVASWALPAVPNEQGQAWDLVQRGVSVDASRGVPSWWMSVLFVLAALAAHGQARWQWLRRSAVAAAAWWVIAAAMVWISVDHALGFHSVVPRLTRDLLPGALGEHPVEVVMVAVLAPAGLVALVLATPAQRLLLVVAAAATVAGQVVVGHGYVELGLSEYRRALVEAALQWSGAIALMAAAGSQGRAGRRRRA